MTDEYKGRLRRIDLNKMLAEPPDSRPLYCPTCRSEITAGYCRACGIDWCDGLAHRLRAANPHIYGHDRG